MGLITRLKSFLPGTKASAAEVNAEFDNIINGHNATDNVLTTHIVKTADSTSSDTTKDKHVSNKDMKDISTFMADLQSSVDGASGADKIKATPISTSPDTVQGILEWLKNQQDSVVLGQIPDGAVTPQKLSFDPATQAELDLHGADYVSHVEYAAASGSANNYAITLNPAPIAYVEGMAVSVKININSTAASTLNVNGLGAKSILKANGTAVTNLKANGIYTMRYSSPNFILQGEGGSGDATASDILAGKTAATDNGDLTGTMVDRAALTITPGTADQVIPAGYHNGSGKVVGDPDLIAANILSGKNIFGVIGSLIQGRPIATGSGTTGGFALFYTSLGANGISKATATVGGLSFTPKTVICMDGSNMPFAAVSSDLGYVAGYPAILWADGGSNYNTFRAGQGAGYLTAGGFCLPHVTNNAYFSWVAIG